MDVDFDSIAMDADEYGNFPLSKIEALIAKSLQTPLGSHKAFHTLQDLDGSEAHVASLKTELLGYWRMKWDDDTCAEILRNRNDSYELLQHGISDCAKCYECFHGEPKKGNARTFCLALKEEDVKDRDHLFFKATFQELVPQCTENAQWFQTCMERMSYNNWYTCMEDMSYSDWCKAAIAAAGTKNNANFLELIMQNLHPGMGEENGFKSILLIKIVDTACLHSYRPVISSLIRSLQSQTPETKETITEELDEPEEVTIRKVQALRDIKIDPLVLRELKRRTEEARLYEVKGELESLLQM